MWSPQKAYRADTVMEFGIWSFLPMCLCSYVVYFFTVSVCENHRALCGKINLKSKFLYIYPPQCGGVSMWSPQKAYRTDTVMEFGIWSLEFGSFYLCVYVPMLYIFSLCPSVKTTVFFVVKFH